MTHKRAKPNLEFLQKYGLERFVEKQSKRIGLLEEMLKDFDDGRFKSYYCIATTLLPTSDLEISLKKAKQKLETERISLGDGKAKSKIL